MGEIAGHTLLNERIADEVERDEGQCRPQRGPPPRRQQPPLREDQWQDKAGQADRRRVSPRVRPQHRGPERQRTRRVHQGVPRVREDNEANRIREADQAQQWTHRMTRPPGQEHAAHARVNERYRHHECGHIAAHSRQHRGYQGQDRRRRCRRPGQPGRRQKPGRPWHLPAVPEESDSQSQRWALLVPLSRGGCPGPPGSFRPGPARSAPRSGIQRLLRAAGYPSVPGPGQAPTAVRLKSAEAAHSRTGWISRRQLGVGVDQRGDGRVAA